LEYTNRIGLLFDSGGVVDILVASEAEVLEVLWGFIADSPVMLVVDLFTFTATKFTFALGTVYTG
jgi:hypothetical protein